MSETASGDISASISISAWFWNPDIWLPPNVTWESFQETPQDSNLNRETLTSSSSILILLLENLPTQNGEFAQFTDLWYPIPIAVILMLIRFLVEKFIFKPIGLKVGMKDHKRLYPRSNTVLEAAFRKSNSPSHQIVKDLSQQTKLTELEVQRWFRQRKQAELPSTLQKFCETGWRFVFYTVIFVYGLAVLWTKHWFWDIEGCWIDYPKHKISFDVWLYYMLELSFYWSLCFSQFFDVQRKDFWEMFIHHQATIALIMFSWTTHFLRMGTLVMIVHDCGDPLLELAKLLRYANYSKSSEAVLVVFTPIWVISRCVVFPGWILKSTIFDALKFSEYSVFPAYYIFNGLLCILQCLHVMWTYLLFKAIHRAMTKSESIDDIRSDTEEESEEYESSKKTK